MTMKPLTGLLPCVLLLWNGLLAQTASRDGSGDKSAVTFGKMTPADFNVPAPPFDSTSPAVVIADIGETHLGFALGKFYVLTRHFRRIKILDERGYDASKVEIILFSGERRDALLSDLHASTYNLENGKIEVSKLDEKSVFTDKINKSYSTKKFSFPGVKKGSIIEYDYSVQSDYLLYVPSWDFQGKYPCLWSEYEVTIPDYLKYVFLAQGYRPFFVKTAKDIPGLEYEPFVTTLNNHISKIEFQLSQIEFPTQLPRDMMGNWFTLSGKLMESEHFGTALDKNNGWMGDELKQVIKGETDQVEKARKIYAFLRDSFTCTNPRGAEVETSLKEVFRTRKGTEAEINLLLTALLNHVGIVADPVIAGTREHGYTNPVYPLLTRFNYVICRAAIDSVAWYLDASSSWTGFGQLPEYLYNGHARVVNKTNPQPVYFEADSLKEKSTTFVVINNDGNGGIAGSFQSTQGLVGSSKVREKVYKEGEAGFFKAIKESYTSEFSISDMQIDSLKIKEEPVKISYSFSYKPPSEGDLIYFRPMLGEGYKMNPFKEEKRLFPVEMPYALDEVYILSMAVPDGYQIDELPKSAKVLLNGTDGFFEFVVDNDGQNIQMRSRLKLNKANFGASDYETLRDFYAMVVKKQNEQIVFKKKK